MQRAPVFIFESAREARAFRGWVREHMDALRREADATTRSGKLQEIEIYLASKFAYLRFDFTTGDAAGQNMVGRATFAACCWILQNNPTIRRFYLESNLATDKKASQVNVMRTRGKRVTAECLVRREVLREVTRVEPESLAESGQVVDVEAEDRLALFHVRAFWRHHRDLEVPDILRVGAHRRRLEAAHRPPGAQEGVQDLASMRWFLRYFLEVRRFHCAHR